VIALVYYIKYKTKEVINMNKLTRENVYESLQEELKTIKELQEVEEYTENEEYREPLSIDKTTEVKILLSWGGPEDGYKLRFNSEKELENGVYYKADWGEYKEVELTDEEAQTIFDFYMGGYLE
jgi:hypothetical protein